MEILTTTHNDQRKTIFVCLATNIAILSAWIWLFRPVFAYLGTIFTRQEFRTNQVVLLAVLALIVLQARRGHFQVSLGVLPQLHLPGLVIAISGSAAFIAAEHWLDINTLSAALFGLATYGLLGLWMEPRRWRQGLPAALLLVGVLPFGEHMETFIGYPLRLATARLVSQGLATLGVSSLGVDTILIFENGLSQVDSPCSGLKSLWTGGLFLLAATWIEARPINRRWLVVAVTFVVMLFASNLARVAILVLVGQVGGLRLLAEMLHVPLGIIGFGAACAAAIGLLRWSGAATQGGHTGSPLPQSTAGVPGGHTQTNYVCDLPLPKPRWLAPTLVVALILFVFLYAPPPQPAAAATFAWKFPSELATQAWPLDSVEMKWLSNDGSMPLSASRWRFTYRGAGGRGDTPDEQLISGSILFIASDTWRAHHRPERCFGVYGLEIQESRLHMVAQDFPLRWLTLGSTQNSRSLYTAAYWLQSSQRVTDDYSVRIWDDMAPQPQPWVLVTVLFDNPVDPAATDIEALLLGLRQTVQDGLLR